MDTIKVKLAPGARVWWADECVPRIDTNHMRALEIAHTEQTSPEYVVQRAEVYLKYLTEHDKTPAPDFEVTDAMADAGVHELKRRGIHAPPSALMGVYKAMTRAKGGV